MPISQNENNLKLIFHGFIDLLMACGYWICIAPIGLLPIRRSHRVVVIGRDNGMFVDNAKYAYLAALDNHEMGFDVAFMSECNDTVTELKGAGLKVLRYPGLRAIAWCLTASMVVIDSAEWVRKGRLQLLLGACRVQLWHGIPLKQIERALLRKRLGKLSATRRFFLVLYKMLMGRWCRLDVLVSTSRRVTDDLLLPAFKTNRVITCGYPRNDVFLKQAEPSKLELINTSLHVFRECKEFRLRGGKVCLYMPTFRQGYDAGFDDVIDLSALNQFAITNNMLFVFKLHPILSGEVSANFSNIIAYPSGKDVYPLIRFVDVLCTDYSSVFFDFLLTNKPIVFFAHDVDSYVVHEREFNMNYRGIAPGPVCSTQEELERSLLMQISNPKEYERKRDDLRHYSFEELDDGAGARFWREMKKLEEGLHDS